FRLLLGFAQATLSDKKAEAKTGERAYPNGRCRYRIVVRDAAQQSHDEPRIEQGKELLKGCVTRPGDSDYSAFFLAVPACRDHQRNQHRGAPDQVVPIPGL